MQKINILIIGSGAREHALAWKLTQSPYLNKLYFIGQNLGITKLGGQSLIAKYSIKQHQAIIEYCLKLKIDLVIIGGEEAIFNDLATELQNQQIATLAPNKMAAKLESSKIYAKEFMQLYAIPTAKYQIFCDEISALNFIKDNARFPLVIKLDIPAFGKGVAIAHNVNQAEQSIKQFYQNYNSCIIIEEYLQGKEISFFILSNGQDYINFGYARDYKSSQNNNEGPNTGGMGALAYKYLLTPELIEDIEQKIIKPTFFGLKNSNIEYKGILFFGLILTKTGPKLLEYNARLGDPESQALLPLIKNDILPLLYQAAQQKPLSEKINWHDEYSINVVLAALGYPNSISSTEIILPEISSESTNLFIANLKHHSGDIYHGTSGRILNIQCKNSQFSQARNNCYEILSKLKSKNCFYRTDIGL